MHRMKAVLLKGHGGFEQLEFRWGLHVQQQLGKCQQLVERLWFEQQLGVERSG